jgi:hypothetical protein
MHVILFSAGSTELGRRYPWFYSDQYRNSLSGRHKIITAAYALGADVRVQPGRSLWTALGRAGALSATEPSLIIFDQCDILPPPPDIERLPIPILAITADWDYRLPRVAELLPILDGIISTSRETDRIFKALGARLVIPAHINGHFLPGIHPCRSFKQREIDLLYTGHMSDEFPHRPRAEWIERIGQLGERYKVMIGWGSFPAEEYTYLLETSRLVFTYHRRGEVTSRFGDALAAGAVPVDSGIETAMVFRPDVEYIRADPQGFLMQCTAILNDPDRWAQIQSAGQSALERVDIGILFDKMLDDLAARYSELDSLCRQRQVLISHRPIRAYAAAIIESYQMGPSLPRTPEIFESLAPHLIEANNADTLFIEGVAFLSHALCRSHFGLAGFSQALNAISAFKQYRILRPDSAAGILGLAIAVRQTLNWSRMGLGEFDVTSVPELLRELESSYTQIGNSSSFEEILHPWPTMVLEGPLPLLSALRSARQSFLLGKDYKEAVRWARGLCAYLQFDLGTLLGIEAHERSRAALAVFENLYDHSEVLRWCAQRDLEWDFSQRTALGRAICDTVLLDVGLIAAGIRRLLDFGYEAIGIAAEDAMRVRRALRRAVSLCHGFPRLFRHVSALNTAREASEKGEWDTCRTSIAREFG